MSVVEQILREDPAGVYARMDFATRDRYRHAIEQIARRSRVVGSEVAAQGDPAGARASRSAEPGADERARPRRLLPDRRGLAGAGTRGGVRVSGAESLRGIGRAAIHWRSTLARSR